MESVSDKLSRCIFSMFILKKYSFGLFFIFSKCIQCLNDLFFTCGGGSRTSNCVRMRSKTDEIVFSYNSDLWSSCVVVVMFFYAKPLVFGSISHQSLLTGKFSL